MGERLHELIERGAIAELRAALKRHPLLIHQKTDDGDSLLHVACYRKNLEMVEELLAYGPDVDARGRHGRTPLHCAVHRGDARSTAIVQRLLAAGASPELKDEN